MGIYYDLNKLLSHNKILNFVIGPRGGGKSFAAKKWAINGWLKNRKEFIYLRRYNTELLEIGNWFSDIASFYPEHEFAVEGGHFFIDGEVAGYYIALSTSQQKKSVSYPNVNKIIFDEFIIDKGRVTYLKEEVQMFLDFYETVARLREDVTALLIANAITVVNPYFTYFHIYPKSNSKFITKSEVCVEIYRNDDFMAKKKNTKFGSSSSPPSWAAVCPPGCGSRCGSSGACATPSTPTARATPTPASTPSIPPWAGRPRRRPSAPLWTR